MVHQSWKLGFNQTVMFTSFLSVKLYAYLNHRGMPWQDKFPKFNKIFYVWIKRLEGSKGHNSLPWTTQFSSVQSLSHVWLFVTPWTAAHQASLSITNTRTLLKPMSIESVMPSNHLILCCPLLLLPPIPPSIRVFPNKSTLRMRWPKYWSFSFSISLSNDHPGLISFRMDWLDLFLV